MCLLPPSRANFFLFGCRVWKKWPNNRFLLCAWRPSSEKHWIIGRIQILVLTNCQAINTEIGTDSLKI